MTERITCDASVLVAMLVDGGPAGQWATSVLTSAAGLLAPHLALFEAANILRRHEMAEIVTGDQAAQAHADLLDLPIDLWPYDVLARRAWQLRKNLSVYDASSVALAEMTDTTLDARRARAPNVACVIASPPV